jgi:hypothetical protein
MVNAEAVVAQIAALGFAQRLAPLRLRSQQPSWCVWFFGVDDLIPDKVQKRLEHYGANPAAPVEHIVVARLKDAQNWKGWEPVAALSSVRAIFLLSENGPAKRPLTILADAAMVHVYCGWKRYCIVQDGEIGNALLHVQNYRLHALGASFAVPDWEYHTARWAQQIEAELISAWQVEFGSASAGTIESRLESLRSLLPTETGASSHSYEIVGATGAERILIQVANEKFIVLGHFAENQCKTRRTYSSQDELMNWLNAIRTFHQLLGFAALPNLNRVLTAKSLELLARWREKLQSYLTSEHPPRGFLKACRERLNHAGTWCRENKDAMVVEEDGRNSFAANEMDSLKKIAAIPNLLGVFLRLALPGLCLTWLLLTPRFWIGKTDSLQEQAAHNVLLTAIAGMGLLTATAFGYLLYFHWRAVRAVERTRSDVIGQHFNAVSTLIVGQFSQDGEKLAKQVVEWGRSFDSLCKKVQEWRPSVGSLPPNGNLFFSGECMDSLIRQRLPVMVEEAHRRFQSGLPRSEFLEFDFSRWQALMKENARAISQQAAEKLSFDECLKARNPTPEEKARLLEDLVCEARTPSLDMPHSANPSPVAVTADTTWGDCASGLPRPVFCDVRLQKMLAVGIIPVATD